MVLLLFVTTTTANNSTTVNNNSNDGKSTNKVTSTLMCETAQHSTICDSDQIPSPHTALGAFP